MVKPEINSFTSRQPRKLKFGMKDYFNPTRRNMNKTHKNRVKPKTSSSRKPRKHSTQS